MATDFTASGCVTFDQSPKFSMHWFCQLQNEDDNHVNDNDENNNSCHLLRPNRYQELVHTIYL